MGVLIAPINRLLFFNSIANCTHVRDQVRKISDSYKLLKGKYPLCNQRKIKVRLKEMKLVSPLVPALKSNWLMMHVSIMILSYAILISGSLISILFLVISKSHTYNKYLYNKKRSSYNHHTNNAQYNINSNHYVLFNRMDILKSLDNLSYRVIGLGFPLLTIGIIAGAVWANEAWGSYWSWDPKETWALITWLVFASYLHSRLSTSWKGEKPAILASIGFVVVWICYLGVNFLGKGLHSYGWFS